MSKSGSESKQTMLAYLDQIMVEFKDVIEKTREQIIDKQLDAVSADELVELLDNRLFKVRMKAREDNLKDI